MDTMRSALVNTSALKWMQAVLLLFFCLSLFLRLGQPLLWNDEGMTVMHGRRVLEYGYPKAWDGKNMVNDLMHPNKRLGIESETGAFIGGSGWGHYYYLAPFIAMTSGVEDLHARTALLRLAFALAGFAGILLLAGLLRGVTQGLPERDAFLLLFGVLVLSSIPLVLHLRELRYYSLLVLLSSLQAGLYVRHRIIAPNKLLPYTLISWLVLGMLLITFSPAFFVFVAAMGIFELVRIGGEVLKSETGRVHLEKGKLMPAIWSAIRNNLAVPFSLVYLIPFFRFFNTFEISRELLAFNVQLQPYAHYVQNLGKTFGYMVTFEPGILWLGLKLGMLLFLRRVLSEERHSKIASVSLFLALLTVSYLVLCSRVPNFPFTRYFLPAIPLLYAGTALDALLLWRSLASNGRRGKIVLSSAIALLFLPTAIHNRSLYVGHVRELVSPPQGHLDVMIPWIKEHYPDTERLVIAANYEETSFMHYLDAKVIVGYVQNNLEEEAGIVPDIIYFNELWKWGANGRLLKTYFENADYEEVRFPVRLYRVNNVPEVNYQEEITHQFKTLHPRWEGDDAVLWVRKDSVRSDQ